jgi:hypothetical protein
MLLVPGVILGTFHISRRHWKITSWAFAQGGSSVYKTGAPSLCSPPLCLPVLPGHLRAPSLTVQHCSLADPSVLGTFWDACVLFSHLQSGFPWLQPWIHHSQLPWGASVYWPSLTCLSSQLWPWGCPYFSDRILLVTWILKCPPSSSQWNETRNCEVSTKDGCVSAKKMWELKWFCKVLNTQDWILPKWPW